MSWGTEPEMDLGLAPPKPGMAHVEEVGSDRYGSALHSVSTHVHMSVCGMYMSVEARSSHSLLPLRSTLCFETMSH